MRLNAGLVATLLALLLAAAGQAQPSSQQGAIERLLAVTFDDLPWVGGLDEAATARAATERLLDALRAHAAPATVFVIGGRLAIGGERAVGEALLRAWRDAGHRLENHGFAHLALSAAEVPDYLDDVRRGAHEVRVLLRELDTTARERFFRAPFNDTGADAQRHAALLQALRDDDVALAPFTVEHSDYVFNHLFVDALARGDAQEARRVGDAYMAQLDVAFDFAEELTLDTFGAVIPHVLLLHANALNAQYLAAMLDRLTARGYCFVDLGEAVRHPAYATPVGEPTRWGGWSWLHRWRAGLGKSNRLRDEPDPPQWVMDASAALRAAR